ncbi:hypothetical protein AB0O67_29315 [Streptomyces sp. NPDC086077]|uniref:hypothetical protein n=1 Tax=Streptomyces sp. NPDC086077 TaxID=3154862 RepID=UPI00342FC594
MGRRIAVGAAVALLIAGVAGCAQAQSASPDGGSAGTVLSEAALDLAVRAGPYRDDQQVLRQAEYKLTRRCMAARGFDYPASGSGTIGIDDSWHPDLETRRSRGYGFADPGPSPGDQYPPGLPAAERNSYVRALTGDPERRAVLRLSSGPEFTFGTTGCIAESRIGLYGDVVDAARVSYVPQEAHNALNHPIVSSSAMREAMALWTSCMRDREYPYESMEEARADALRSHDSAGTTDAARRAEIRIAVADGECALVAGLPKVVDRVGRRHAARLSAEQRADLSLATQLRAEALQRARRIVNGSR